MLSGLVYLCLTLLGLLPVLLAEAHGIITCKKVLSILMTLLALAAIGGKTYLYIQVSNGEVQNADRLNMFGVWQANLLKTFIIDVLQVFYSMLLIVHYSNQQG
jgi:hypothetical protein